MRGNIRGNTWKLTEVSRNGAMALMLVLATAGGAGPAWAQAAKPATHNFEIRAGDLATALLQFADQSGVQVLFEADLVTGLEAPAVRGRLTADEALARLLQDSGLERPYVNGSTVVLKRAPAAAPPETATGTLTGRVTQAGEPVAGVTITATSAALKESRVVTTGDEGNYELTDLPPGAYSLRFELEGLVPVVKKAEVSPEESTTLDVQMSLHEVREDIVVTGSNIRRAEVEGPSPVIFINREDLDRSGRSTVAEALAQLPQNFASPILAGLTGNGAQTVNLRGLGRDNTLVLVNGRRVASSGASGNTPFVDLNSIPLAAVERIEVLTDGASALYGSDAVTGVVNIILKEDFRGSEISVDYGASVEGGASERQASFNTGWAKGGFKAMVSGESFNRNRLASSERSFSRTDDLRAQGGLDLRPFVANPGTVFSLDGQNLPGLDAPVAGIPAGQDGRDLTPADFAATAGQLNRGNFADFLELVPESDRFGLNGRLDWELTSRLTVFTEAGASHNESEATSIPPTFFVVVPAGNPFNPFGVPVQVSWLATELATTSNFETDSQRVLAGLEGRLGPSWAWETSFGYSRDEFESQSARSTFGPIVDELLSRTDPATALNVFGDGAGVNSPEVLAELGFGRETVDGVGDVLTVAGKADGPVLEWAGRALRAALGWEYRDESLETEVNTFEVDPQVPSFTSTLAADRQVVAGFVELALPLFGPEHDISGLRALELQVAARFEDYSDFGNTTDPKLALRWQPIESLAVRGSLGTSFRAPSLGELFRVQSSFSDTVTDPMRNDEVILVDLIFGGNPDLEPEKSRSWNLGFAWDAPFLPGLSLTTDLWGLRQREQITGISANALLAAEALFPNRVTRAAPTPEDIAAGLPGRLLAVDTRNLNASEARLRGVDAGLNYVTDSRIGRFDLRFNGAYIYRATQQLTPVSSVEQLAGVLSGVFVGENTNQPTTKFRANLSLFWSRGAWEVGVTERHTRRSRDPFSTLHPIVDDHFETDVQVNYAWPGETGWLAGTRLSLGAENVFNEEPPFRDNTFGFSSTLHSPRQAFYHLRLTKAF